jgi:hypothetical protein
MFVFIFDLCLCLSGGLFECNTTSLHLAVAHLVLFVASQILTPDSGRIKSVWRSIASYNLGRAGRLAPVSPSKNSAYTALLIAQKQSVLSFLRILCQLRFSDVALLFE